MDIVVVIGAGLIGQAIARRVAVGNHVVLADRSEANANGAAQVMANAGYEVSIATVDMSSRQAVRALVVTATVLGKIVGLIHAAGVSPSEATPDTILHVDLDGTAVVLEEFGDIVARGGFGVVISSQSAIASRRSASNRTRRSRLHPRTNCSRSLSPRPSMRKSLPVIKPPSGPMKQRDRRRRLLVRPGRRSARPINAPNGED